MNFDMENKSEKKSISKAEINDLPLISWEGPIHLLEDIEAMVHAVETLSKETHLGFDTETRPSFKKGQFFPPALHSVSFAEAVYLFRINKPRQLPPSFLLESDTIKDRCRDSW